MFRVCSKLSSWWFFSNPSEKKHDRQNGVRHLPQLFGLKIKKKNLSWPPPKLSDPKTKKPKKKPPRKNIPEVPSIACRMVALPQNQGPPTSVSKKTARNGRLTFHESSWVVKRDPYIL